MGRTAGKASTLEKRRLRAIEIVEKEGLSQIEAAKQLKVNPRTIRRWLQWHRGRGPRKLEARKTPGRPMRLKHDQREKLQDLLLEGAGKAGFDSDLWSCRRVAAVIKKEFGVKYHVDYISTLLRSMGWSPQKPERVAIERDEAKVRGWRRRSLPRIKKKLESAGPR